MAHFWTKTLFLLMISIVMNVPPSAGARNNLRFEHISIEHGLSQNSIRCILQDKKGFLWFGTEGGGLNKYDGYEFILYKPEPDNSLSISHNVILELYEDRSGNIWIGTDGGGLNRFNREKETFTRYQNDPDDPGSLSHNIVSAIYEDRSGNLWVGTRGGLNRFEPESETFVRYQNNPAEPFSLSHDSVSYIYEDKAGVLWIGTTGGGLCRGDRAAARGQEIRDNNPIFIPYTYDPRDPYSLSHNWVSAIFEDSSGNLWIGTEGGGLNRMDRKNSRFTAYRNIRYDPNSLSHDEISAIHEDKSGTLWIGTAGGGLNRFDPENKKFIRYQHDPSDPNSLSHNVIWSLCEDRSGILWIGTYTGGVNKLDRKSEKFIHYRNDPGNPDSLSHNVVWVIYEDRQGELWIGTDSGLNRFDRKTQKFFQYRHDADKPYSLSDNEVWSVCEDHKGNLWIGTENGLNRMEREYGMFFHYPKSDSGLTSHRIRVIYEDSRRVLWVGTDKGLNRLNRDTETFTAYQYSPVDPAGLSSNDIWCIYEDHRGILWIGTENGLNAFDREKEQFVRYQADPDNPDALSHNWVLSIYEDHQKYLWVGTLSGLNQFGRSLQTFRHYREKDGLPNDVIYGILEDDTGRLWMSTNRGLSVFDPAAKVFSNYDVRDGLQSNEFNVSAYCKAEDGEMFFGGMNGLNAFYPRMVEKNRFIPPVVITDFQIFNKSVTPSYKGSPLEKCITETKHITLSYKQNVFSYEFAALNYTRPEKNQYAYIMEGFDEAWNYIGTRRFVTYTNLPPGEYIFRVIGSNNDGVWNKQGVSVSVTITPPVWKTWWAYLVYIFFGISVIAWYLRRQAKKLEQERQINERLRQVDKLKDAFLANTSHELRTPLHGIIGIAESLMDGAAGIISENMRVNLSMVISSARRLAALVNDILDFSKLKSHELQLRRKPVSIKVLAEIVLKMTEPLIREKDLILRNDIAADTPRVDADEDRLQQILYNLIGNAIKFTKSGSVTVSARVLPASQAVQISVSDTGIGIPPNEIGHIFDLFEQGDRSVSTKYGGTGLGLSVTKQLVELHGGDIRVESEPGKGTAFFFTLPASNAPETAEQLSEEITRLKEDTVVEVQPLENRGTEAEGIFNILVVDDEPVNQQVLSNYLSRHHYTIRRAMDGEEALRAIDAGEKFDLMLLDIMMPNLSGYEVCQRVREKYLPSELPVIMLTAKNQISDLVEAFSAGANDYLAKPFSKSELLARIKTHLNLLKINTAYSRFFPQNYLRFLEKESVVEVHLGDHISKEMAVMFSDIRSFTSLSEKMSPRENFDFINAYFRQISPVIRNHKGFIVKYLGDGMMAAFPDGPEDAIRAGIDKLKQVAFYNKESRKKGFLPVQIGIGVHIGYMMVGIIGEAARMQGDAFSDNVNLASRLEGLTKFYGVSFVISEEVFKSLANPDEFYIRFLDRVQVKGRENPVSVFEICDGDPEEVIALKMKTKLEFAEGQSCYFAGDFSKSAECFRKVLRVHPGDTAVKLYLDRSEQFMSRGAPKGWQGIERRAEK
jgi:signal transduction histidine kinase/ligand-binding sensor domain-containing protein/class 3 adenylate cyclase